MTDTALNSAVSFGLKIYHPDKLEDALVGTMLDGIHDGRWSEVVGRVRRIRTESAMQEAKKELPYFTPSGLFSHRSDERLLKHSGIVSIDLDKIGARGVTRAIQVAVEDRYCLFAFRSASARGVRLGFRCPPCDSETHKRIFAIVAARVRERYGFKPDLSVSDVCRASFVSFDRGLWLNASAGMLPCVKLASHRDSLCEVGAVTGLDEGDRNTLAYGLGESRAPWKAKPDGTAYTHEPLMLLARGLVVHYRRHSLPLTAGEIERALTGWWRIGRRRFPFSKDIAEYREELRASIRSIERVPWLNHVVNFWPRWTREPEFPKDGTARERLEWALRRHCAESGETLFFIGARDAATITGTSARGALDNLYSLVGAGVLELVSKKRIPGKAFEYRLLK